MNFCYALTETRIEITTGSVENKIRCVGLEQKVVQEKLKELRQNYNEAFTVLSEAEGEHFSLKRGTTILTMQIQQVRLLEDE